jgi:hypothetical protein
MEVILNMAGALVGILAVGLIFYHGVRLILFKFVFGRPLLICTFLISSLLALLVYSYLTGFGSHLVYYVLGTFIWFCIDLIIFERGYPKKKRETKHENNNRSTYDN